MAREPLKIEFISSKPAAPEEKPGAGVEKTSESAQKQPSLQEIARKAAERFTQPEEKRRFLIELAKELRARIDELSPELRTRFYNGKEDLDLNSVTAVYGLREHLSAEITPEGGLREADEDTTAKIPGEYRIPERPAGAKGGQELLREWGLNRNMNAFQDQLADNIIREIERGNVPDSCRNMHTITMQGEDGTKISFRTSAGYLAVGSNQDHVRVPLSGYMAKRIADHFGWTLPTAGMAAATDRAADLQLRIGGETHNDYDLAHMADLEYARKHNQRAQKSLQRHLNQINKRAAEQGQPPLTANDLSRLLIRGEKKNIFIGQRSDQGGIGIGGLLDTNGNPIQPYQYPHSKETGPNGETGYHGDYSQSIAIQAPKVTIVTPDGKSHSVHLYKALRDPKYAKILNPSEAGKNDGVFIAENSYQRRGNFDSPTPRRRGRRAPSRTV
jgi:hypothetical protein